MPDHREPLMAERLGEAEHIIGECIESVGGAAGRLIRQIVAALVGRHYP
jgi:hypothetical protein